MDTPPPNVCRAPNDSAQPEPFRFLYFTRLAGRPAWDETSGDQRGRIRDFLVQATVPYPTVCGLELDTARGPVSLPWSAVRDMRDTAAYLAPANGDPPPAYDYTVRRDLLGQLAVEVSTTQVIRIRDLHFVYSEGRMVLAHAETGIRGVLRRTGLEKPLLATLARLLPAALFRERFATFRHLQFLPVQTDGSVTVPARIAEMHPADLARVLMQLPTRLCRPVFDALAPDLAARVLRESETRLQARLLAACRPERREVLLKRMASLRDSRTL